MNLSWSSLYPH